METIFDYNPTKEELGRFGIKAEYGSIPIQIQRFKDTITKDDCNYQLGILFAIRGNSEKAATYYSKIENKKMLGTLIQDF